MTDTEVVVTVTVSGAVLLATLALWLRHRKK